MKDDHLETKVPAFVLFKFLFHGYCIVMETFLKSYQWRGCLEVEVKEILGCPKV